jgi:hypothetical protein
VAPSSPPIQDRTEERSTPDSPAIAAVPPIVPEKETEPAQKEAPSPFEGPERPPLAATPVGSFDPDGVFRVASAEESRAAAHLSLLRIWGKGPEKPSPGDLSDPGATDRWIEASGLDVNTVPLIVSRISFFDYPVVFQILGSEKAEARWVVLSRLGTESAELLDPIEGRSKVSIRELEGRWIGEGTLLWKRLSGIEDPLPDRGESVRSLQVLLSDEGLLPLRKFDGFFGPLTRKAILDFQARAGLKTDGSFNPETHLVLARWRRPGATPSLSRP